MPEDIVVAKDSLLRIETVSLLTSLPKSSIWELVNLEKFPRPYKISIRRDAWKESEIMQYIGSLSH